MSRDRAAGGRPRGCPSFPWVSPLATLTLAIALMPGALCAEPAPVTGPKPLTQYHHDLWQTQNGLPTNGVRALVQTRDGYLWIGTEAGLVRFDGAAFTVFDRNSKPALRATNVSALFEDRNGQLWIGTDDGSVIRRRSGEFEDIAPNRFRGGVTAFHQRSDGALWVAGGDEVARIEDSGLVTVNGSPGAVAVFFDDEAGQLRIGTNGPQGRIDEDRISSISPDLEDVQAAARQPDGTLWLGLKTGLLRLGAQPRLFTVRHGLPSNDVRRLFADRSGGVWIGTTAGLAHLVNERIAGFTLRDGLSDGVVTALLQDREGSVWIGTRHGGLNRLRHVPFAAITRRQGLADDDVLSVFEDRLGALWVGTDGAGLTNLRGDEHFTWTVEEGLPSNVVWTIADTADGAIWVGTPRGLARIFKGRVTSFVGKEGYPQGAIRAIHEDRAGNLWVGNRAGLHRLKGDTITTFTRANGLSSNHVSVIREEPDGTLWIGTFDGGVNKLKRGTTRFIRYTTAQGLRSNDVSAILCDGQYVWVGTLDGSLHRARNDRMMALPVREGASAGHALQILDDRRGSLWVTGQRGITRFERSALLKVSNGQRDYADATLFDHHDGFGRWEFHGVSQSSGIRRSDGKLLFPSATGVVIVDSTAFSRSLVAPPVHVESIVAEGTRTEPGRDLVLPAGLKQLEFHYTALSFAIPERVRFRYRLEGVDVDWVDAGNRRTAFYPRVPGGRYRFQVVAANADGAWNATGATVELRVRSRLWETTWFYALCGLGLVLGGVQISRLRVRRIKARERVLESLVEARTAQLSDEISERRKVEEVLRQSHDELEDRVRERTTKLTAAYAQLQRDVAERRRLEDQLAQVQKLESIGRLAGGVAHDINNVLTVVLSYSDLVDAGLGPAHPLQMQLRQIRKAAERASNLTHRLLAFARRQVVEPRIVNLGELALNLDQMLRRLIGEDVELTTVTSPNLWSVKADPHQIEQVLVNLAVNARDAMPSGGTLRIETTNVFVDESFAQRHPTLAPGEYVRMSVSDTGVGMDEHVMKHMFEPFFTTKEPGKGTGLGLATCYGIVQQLDGAIYPESELGKGTTFSVFLPRIDMPAEPTPRTAEHRVARGSETVLLVEDEPLVREIAKSALSDQGYQVLEAEHGEEALVVAREHDAGIALVLTDVVMPKMGGRELVELLRRERPGIRVLYMSGYAAATIDEQDVDEPGTSFLRKPFALAEMLGKVREVLDGRPAPAEAQQSTEVGA
jgi:signal transduction histidine kinase/ligand-binding sensor domain-containing protein/CheY-like chemotaxis protein